MRIITTRVISRFLEKHTDAAAELHTWIYDVEHAQWKSTSDIKARYRSADFLADNRVVFYIKDNHYRLIVKIHYNTGHVFIRFLGSHAQYARIDAETI